MEDDYTTNSHYITYTFSFRGWENVLFELGSDCIFTLPNRPKTFADWTLAKLRTVLGGAILTYRDSLLKQLVTRKCALLLCVLGLVFTLTVLKRQTRQNIGILRVCVNNLVTIHLEVINVKYTERTMNKLLTFAQKMTTVITKWATRLRNLMGTMLPSAIMDGEGTALQTTSTRHFVVTGDKPRGECSLVIRSLLAPGPARPSRCGLMWAFFLVAEGVTMFLFRAQNTH